MKFHVDGTFACPSDLSGENIKLVDDAINQSGNKGKVFLGIQWGADDFWSDDKDGYEFDNAKKALTEEQLIDHYVGICRSR